MDIAHTFVKVKGHHTVILGILSWAIQQVSFHVIEGVPVQFTYYYDDWMTILRPTINLIYNGSFRQPLTADEMKNIPQSLRVILAKAESNGECLPNEGSYPATGILLYSPAILLTALFDLTPESFELILIILSKIFSLLSFWFIFYLISLVYGCHPKLFVIMAALPLLMMPPQVSFYTNTAEYYFIFALLAITLSFIYIQKRYRWAILLAQSAFVCSYFSKFRAAPLLFIVPTIVFFLEKRQNIRYLLILATLLIWLIPQLLWSYHVYKVTCKWVLTSPSDIFSVSLCGDKKVDTCFSPHQTYNYVRISLGRLEATLGYPHPIQYHPRSLTKCVNEASGEDSQGVQCLPIWIYDEHITKEKWLLLLRNLRAFGSDELSIQDRIRIGKEVTFELEDIIRHIKQKYWWLPLYRAYRVMVDNTFHPIPHKETGRGRFPIWIKKLYFGYHSAYVGIGLILGLFSGILWIVLWLRKRLTSEEKGIGLLFMLSAWGLIVVPVITGHSEWRYFYASAILFMMSAPYFLSKLSSASNRNYS